MRAIFKREITSFFTTPTGSLIIGLFLVLNGLFLWAFKGPFNVFNYGFADLGNFFMLAPFILVIVIPAITMKSFSEEKKSGTLELLFIKPLTLWSTVLGKFTAAAAVTVIALIPTLLYVLAISELGMTVGNFDAGLVTGSYVGLLFLVLLFTAIGIWSSTLTENQIVAFILGLVICFLLYLGLESIATLAADGDLVLFIQNLGIKAHFESIAAGVLDTRDLLYFISITVFFLYLAWVQLKYHSR